MSYKKAEESIQKAHDLRHDNTRFYREFQDKVREEISVIKFDRELSTEGRANRTAEAKRKHGSELMKQAHTRRRQYLEYLKDAKTQAEAEIYAKIKKPDATTLERFEASLRKVKTELLLSTSPKAAAAKLTEFISQVNDPYCAQMIHEQFAELATPIISQAQAGEAASHRHELARTFEGLAGKFESQDVRSARDALEAIEGMTTSSFFIDLVSTATTDTLGREYGAYVNDTDSYFVNHEDERPGIEEKQKPAKTGLTQLTKEEEDVLSKYDFRPKAVESAPEESGTIV